MNQRMQSAKNIIAMQFKHIHIRTVYLLAGDFVFANSLASVAVPSTRVRL